MLLDFGAEFKSVNVPRELRSTAPIETSPTQMSRSRRKNVVIGFHRHQNIPNLSFWVSEDPRAADVFLACTDIDGRITIFSVWEGLVVLDIPAKVSNPAGAYSEK